MSNLAKLDFTALDISDKNYLSWVLDVETHLNANGLGDAIKEKNNASNQDKAKALIFIRLHLHEGLKAEYLTDTEFTMNLEVKIWTATRHLQLAFFGR